MPGEYWTQIELDLLIKHYPSCSRKELSAILSGRSIASIAYKASELKLSKLPEPLIKRLWKYVYRYKDDYCWLWIGATDLRGYGVFNIDGKIEKAHRVFYKLYNKITISKQEDIHHICQIKTCVNPDHLLKLTKAEHTRLHHANNGL